jgi:Holliday junction resolvasome RuvABC endonuclease subunit
MLVLGIDPGAMNTGIAWIREHEGVISRAVIRLVCDEQHPFRYSRLREKLESVFATLPERPEAIGVEEPEHRVQGSYEGYVSVLHLEGIYAVIVGEIFRTWGSIPLFPWKPRIWRKVDVDKEMVMEQMGKKYQVDFKNDDESDALGIADYAFSLMKSKAAKRMLNKLHPSSPASAPIIVAPPKEIKKP